jgi:hypothetical protein|tara:strand:+ start:560 stop:1438 length:879 start_codon:yes stop_codon:yes gene_type:complete
MKKSKTLFIRLLHNYLRKVSPNFLFKYYLFFRTVRTFKKKVFVEKQFKKFSKNLSAINNHEYKITSQNNEDGIIEFIFKTIPNNKYFVEIGFGFHESNSLNLIKKNWDGRLVDFDIDETQALKTNLSFFFPKSKIDIINAKVVKDNINELVQPKNTIRKIDFFSLDIDGNDYWVLNALDLTNIKVICCEYNHWLGPEKKLSLKYDPNFIFTDNGIWGASLLALTELLKERGFSLVALDSSGTNAFFVNKKYIDLFEVLSPVKNFISVGRFYNDEKKKKIYKEVKTSKLIIEV